MGAHWGGRRLVWVEISTLSHPDGAVGAPRFGLVPCPCTSATTRSCVPTGELYPNHDARRVGMLWGYVGRSGAGRTPETPREACASPQGSQHFSSGGEVTPWPRFEHGVRNRCEGCSCMVHVAALGDMWGLCAVHGACESLHA